MSNDPSDPSRHFRIGEFSRRVGVEVELLRTWERRYQVVAPARTAGGLRIYGPDDERRVRRMLEHLEAGMSTAEAARLTREESDAAARGVGAAGAVEFAAAAAVDADPVQLWEALDRLDEVAANEIFDRLLAAFSLEGLLRGAILPYLRDITDRWRYLGDSAVAQERFAGSLLRGRLLGLARGWGGGDGPQALLACCPGEHRDLGLICVGLALREYGWRVTFLGPDTPFSTVESTARRLAPDLTVLAADALADEAGAERAFRQIGAAAPLALTGRGVSHRLAAAAGATRLSDEPFTAATTATAGVRDRAART